MFRLNYISRKETNSLYKQGQLNANCQSTRKTTESTYQSIQLTLTSWFI